MPNGSMVWKKSETMIFSEAVSSRNEPLFPNNDISHVIFDAVEFDESKKSIGMYRKTNPRKKHQKKLKYTLPKFNWPLKIGLPKRKLVFQPSFFRGYVKLGG